MIAEDFKENTQARCCHIDYLQELTKLQLGIKPNTLLPYCTKELYSIYMLSFLSSFTVPFMIALLFWPFLALLLTIPILAIQYRRYSKIKISRGIVAYMVILYSLSLVSFTLYPMPSDPVVFCRDYALSPQLIPFSFIHEIQSEGLRAALQVVMNLLFFVPLGVFARAFFELRLRTTFLIAFAVSLFIETAQLTGAFGYYPCSYRLFDINDLLINTFGGIVGYTLAMLIPRKEIEHIEKDEFVRKAGLLRYSVSLIIDQTLAYAVTVFILLATYVLLGNETAISIRDTLFLAVSFTVLNLTPLFAKGWSIGGWVVRLNHDDHPRKLLRRLLFYGVRALILTLIIFPPWGNALISIVIICILLIVWVKKKKLIYQYV